MDFVRFGSNLISVSNSKFSLNREPTRGEFRLVGTGSVGLLIWDVGLK
jgi:hypothetical protein